MTPILASPLIAVEMTSPDRRQIGSARMEQDGTVVLRLRMVAGASVGDVEMRYAPGSADYERVRKHVPSLMPGASVPVYNDWD